MTEDKFSLLNVMPAPEKLPVDIINAISYIDKNFPKIERVAEIAEGLGMNYHTLRDKFRRETRLTLIDYLSRKRVDTAMILLRSTDSLIKEIAWDVGYKYEDQLTRMFQKFHKITPQIFRTLVKNKDLVSMALIIARDENPSK